MREPGPTGVSWHQGGLGSWVHRACQEPGAQKPATTMDQGPEFMVTLQKAAQSPVGCLGPLDLADTGVRWGLGSQELT